MTYLHSFVLGLVQGLGEFLPISSSAHLVIAPWLFQFEDPGLAFDVALHLGTLLAVVCYFWRDWLTILGGTFHYVTRPALRASPPIKLAYKLFWYLVIASVPAALAGVLLNDWAEGYFRAPWLVALNMVALGAVLLWIDKKKADLATANLEEITLKQALMIGCAQAFALLPGVSRSGITITVALILGLNRTASARFSFLLSTPIIFGACLLKYQYFLHVFQNPQALFGIAVSAIFGFLSIKYLMKLLRHYSYAVFSYYRFAFGAAVFALYFARS